LAPSTELYYSGGVEDKYKRRTETFKTMDTNGSHTITWDEYLNFTKLHIKMKLEKNRLISTDVKRGPTPIVREQDEFKERVPTHKREVSQSERIKALLAKSS